MDSKIYKNGAVSTAEVDTDFLGDIVRVRLLRQAVRMYETNKRQGTHKVKTRGELHYRKAPLFRQKGTGRARVRHPQATQCRHGGVSHGPRPRDYSYAIPKRARVEALRSALLSKFRDGEVTMVDSLAFDTPKTKQLAGMLDQLGYRKSCLIVTETRDDNLLLSARNLRRIEVVPASEVNAHQLLFYRNLIVTEAALEQIKERTHEG